VVEVKSQLISSYVGQHDAIPNFGHDDGVRTAPSRASGGVSWRDLGVRAGVEPSPSHQLAIVAALEG
jgi:hypothetical protein